MLKENNKFENENKRIQNGVSKNTSMFAPGCSIVIRGGDKEEVKQQQDD